MSALRLVTLSLLGAAVLSCSAVDRRPAAGSRAECDELQRLAGRWEARWLKEKLAPHEITVTGEDRWGPGFEAVRTSAVSAVFFRIEGDRLRICKSRAGAPFVYASDLYTIRAECLHTPKRLFLTPPGQPREEEGQRFGVCYHLDGDELWWCDLEGNADAPADFSMDVSIQYPKRIWVLRRSCPKSADAARAWPVDDPPTGASTPVRTRCTACI